MAEIKAFGLTIDTDQITDKQKIIFGAAIGILAVGLGIYFNQTTYEDYQAKLAEIDKLTADRDGKLAQVAKLPALKKEYEELQVKLRAMEAKIPRKENIPTLLVDLEKLTDHNEVILQSFVPGALAPVQLPPNIVGDGRATQNIQNQLRQLPIRITSVGAYPDTVSLFGTFERYERTLAADSVTLTPSGNKSKDGFRQLQVAFNLNAYVLLGGQ